MMLWTRLAARLLIACVLLGFALKPFQLQDMTIHGLAYKEILPSLLDDVHVFTGL